MGDLPKTIRIDWALYVKPNGRARIQRTYPEARVHTRDPHGVLYVSSSAVEGVVWVRANPGVVGSHQPRESFERGVIL